MILSFVPCKKGRKKGFTLLEITIALATIVIILTATLTSIDSFRTERGLSVGSELRTLHLAQKNFLIQALDRPGAIDLSSLSLADLQTAGLVPTKLPGIEKVGVTTLRVNVIPPLCTVDGTQRDLAKTGKNSGDLLYDIGPE